MINSRELKNREIINITNGQSLGYVKDIEINLERARIDALIIPEEKSGLFGFFNKNSDLEICWKDIRVIGEDVILVDISVSADSKNSSVHDCFD